MLDRPPADLPADPSSLIRWGRIASVDLNQGFCTVQAGDLVTGPIRWVERSAGDTRTWSPPTVGEQIILLAPEGDIAGAVALRGVSATAFPPAGNSQRELIRYADGALMAYDPQAHHADIILPANATLTLTAEGGLTIKGKIDLTGDLNVNGAVTVAQTVAAQGDVTANGISLQGHHHGGVQKGGALTGVPQ